MQQRIISNLTQSAEERYERFLGNYSSIVQRVPQYALASYLGMTTEFLSKIRNRKVKRKA
jgi:CRP-like cAMP-binding protein